MESVVTVVLQQLCYLVALLLQRLHTKLHSLVQHALSPSQHALHSGIFHLKVKSAHVVSLSRMQHIHRIKLLGFLLVDKQLHLSVKIPLVLQRLLQVLTSKLSLQRVVNHRCLAHLSQRTVQPTAVAPSHRIHT